MGESAKAGTLHRVGARFFIVKITANKRNND
jgi:hypothetical protein